MPEPDLIELFVRPLNQLGISGAVAGWPNRRRVKSRIGVSNPARSAIQTPFREFAYLPNSVAKVKLEKSKSEG